MQKQRARMDCQRLWVGFFLLWAVLITCHAHAGIGVWTGDGPGGGEIFAIAVAPSNPDIVYAGAHGTVFKSTNGGVQWTTVNNSFNSGSAVNIIFAVDPQNPDLVYMGFDGAIYISRDGGTTWSVASDSFQIGTVTAIVFDPLDHNTVYAAGVNGVWKSTDAGVSWANLRGGASALAIYHANAAQPAILYAESNSGGVAKSTDGGATWSIPVAVGYYDYGADGLVVDPTNPDIVYASNREIYRSSNGGATWTQIYDPLDSNFWAGKLTILPQQPNVLYAMLGGTLRRLTISANGTVQSNTVLFGVITNSVYSFSIDPQQPTTMYIGTGGGPGIFKSVDGGANWNESNTGIANLQVSDLVLDPLQPTTLYALVPSGLGSYGVFTSPDRGETWSVVGQPFPPSRGSLAVTRLDSGQPATLYTVQSGGTFISYICRYPALTPGINDWECQNFPIATDIKVLATDPTDAHILYAGVGVGFSTSETTRGIYKSSDGGQAWVQKSTGLADATGELPIINQIAIDPQSPTTLYAIGTLSSISSRHLYKSTDGADQWSVVNFPAGVGPYTIAIDPHDANTLYIGAILIGSGSGVYKSTDGGNTWTPKNTGLTDALGPFAIGTVAIDPQLPMTLYVGTLSTSSKGIFKSIDGGEHWTPLNNGLPESAHHPLALVVDPQDTARVYAGTEHHGVMWLQQTPTADLGVSKTDAPDPVTVGNPLTYTITVTNYGPDLATGVAITETLPQGMTLVSATPSQGTCSQPSVLSCQLGGITKDASATLTVVVTPTTTGMLNNSVTVSASVTDPNPSNNTATAVTTVNSANHPPICEQAQASPARLWPPNHNLVRVAITGILNHNGNPVSPTITGVTQDEPLNGLGDGDTGPDAVLQNSAVLLRAERSGTGNGRVYRVTFTATDGAQGSCTGSVTVCVPHDIHDSCIDDGQVYNSVQP